MSILLLCSVTHSPSLVPRPHPGFCCFTWRAGWGLGTQQWKARCGLGTRLTLSLMHSWSHLNALCCHWESRSEMHHSTISLKIPSIIRKLKKLARVQSYHNSSSDIITLILPLHSTHSNVLQSQYRWEKNPWWSIFGMSGLSKHVPRFFLKQCSHSPSFQRYYCKV